MWTPPISSQEEKKEILKKLDQIAVSLLDLCKTMGVGQGFMGGKIGIALFFAYYGRLKNKVEYVELANEIISDKLDEINSWAQNRGVRQDGPFFSNGLSGTFWLINQLIEKDFIEADANELFSSADESLAKNMLHTLTVEDNYDFLHGSIGIAHYLAKRKVKEYKPHHDLFLNALIQKAVTEEKENTMRWFSYIYKGENFNERERGHNLCLSHGMASIAAYLNEYITFYGPDVKAVDTLKKLVNYMISCKQDVAVHKSYFPTWIGHDRIDKGGRLAWCYGDLGIAYVLLSSAAVLNDKKLEALSMEVLLHTCTRKDPEIERVIDAGLCHGALGIAHIYNRLFNQTGHASFQEAARYWFLEGLKYAKQEDGIAGYKSYNGKGGWLNSPGFLEGVAGIGLAYISSISDISPDWDEGLFLS